MKKLLVFLFFIFNFAFFTPSTANAQEIQAQNIYFFYSNSCSHCKEEKPFLGFLKEEYADKLNVYAFEVGSRNSVKTLQKIAPVVGLETGSVPITILSDMVVVGYTDHESSGLAIRDKLDVCLVEEADCDELIESKLTEKELEIGKITFKNAIKKDKKAIAELMDKYGSAEKRIKNEDQKNATNVSTNFSIPFLGSYDAQNFSLPALALTIGFLDGFNPCAMWVLLFLISLLLGLHDRRKMWIFGITFIVASAFVYFLFMTAWLNAFLFLGVAPMVRVGIALLALGVGAYQLYDYKKHGDQCEITGSEKRQRTFAKLKELVMHTNVLIALAGLIALAFAVNLVELMCSAGFPAIFTSVLAMSDLATWKYYWYIFLYILMFMIDDIAIFAIAMMTLESNLIGQKYAKYSKLVGGILMILIGLLLVFKPELLMFG
ncbi:MAG: hypothetical protein ABFQ62_00115 [Patescibacteria group bacterium]